MCPGVKALELFKKKKKTFSQTRFAQMTLRKEIERTGRESTRNNHLEENNFQKRNVKGLFTLKKHYDWLEKLNG